MQSEKWKRKIHKTCEYPRWSCRSLNISCYDSWKLVVFSKFPRSRDQNSDRVCNFTHVVIGSEAIHYARDHVRTVPIEVGTARVHVQCSWCCRNRSTCVCFWTHRKRMLQCGASEKKLLDSAKSGFGSCLSHIDVFISLWFFTLRRYAGEPVRPHKVFLTPRLYTMPFFVFFIIIIFPWIRTFWTPFRIFVFPSDFRNKYEFFVTVGSSGHGTDTLTGPS